MSRPSFLISGETIVILNLDGKMPSEKERLARVEISSEKTEEQELKSEEDLNLDGKIWWKRRGEVWLPHQVQLVRIL